MVDFTSLWRDFWERPMAYPLLRLYDQFMSIKRYEHMPFYFYPGGVSVVGQQKKLLDYIDWAVDAHEEARNPADKNKTFYMRSVYLYKNFLRYQNDTACNIMFETKSGRAVYDKLNSVISQSNLHFYIVAPIVHSLGFAWMSFFFRFRRIGVVPTLAIASAYYMAFSTINDVLYKVMVDGPVLAQARALKLDNQCQPVGSFKNRNITYK